MEWQRSGSLWKGVIPMGGNAIVRMGVSVAVGIATMVVSYEFLGSVDTSGWSSLGATMAGLAPGVLGVVMVIGTLIGITKVSG